MRTKFLGSLVASVLAAWACDKSSSSDPETTQRDDLNPPSNLVTVTGDGKIELRWNAANAEDDFKGYHVFIAKSSIADLGTPGYPKILTADLTKGAQIPRCKDNSAIFEKFGFKATTVDCEGDTETGLLAKAGLGLAEEGETVEETITNIAVCEGTAADSGLSLAATSPTLTKQKCVVTKDSKGNALENGATYAIFVAAVRGEKKNKLSWTSNFVQDTPAKALFNNTLTIEGGKYYRFDDANLAGSTQEAYAAAPTGDVCPSNSFCTVNKQNAASNEAGIYVGRSGSGWFRQRAFLSVPKDGNIKIQLRGPQIAWENDALKTGVEGDHALGSSDNYVTDGTLFPIYGEEVFDIEVTSGGSKYYGKIVVGRLSMEDATDDLSDLKIPLTIIMQPQAGSTDYLQ